MKLIYLLRASVLGVSIAGAIVILDGKRSQPQEQVDSSPAVRLQLQGAHSSARVAGLSALPIKSLLNVRRPMRYGQFVWSDAGVPAGSVSISVDLANQTISIFRSGHEIGTAVILYGADSKPTPLGSFRVLAKHEKHRSSIYDADMPYTLRLTHDGIAIHASDVRDGRATHGCIGVPIDFAARLFKQAAIGSPVRILRS